MKRIILTALIALSFCYQASASDTQKLPLAEQCRGMLKSIDQGTNKYIYYGGWKGQTLNEPKAKADVQALYQKALDERMANSINALSESRLWESSVEGQSVKQKFCKEEIDALDKIHSQTSQIKEWIISSTSSDCLKILKTTVCKGL